MRKAFGGKVKKEQPPVEVLLGWRISMKQKLMNSILQGMLGALNNAQMKRLQLVLEAELDRYFESDNKWNQQYSYVTYTLLLLVQID